MGSAMSSLDRAACLTIYRLAGVSTALMFMGAQGASPKAHISNRHHFSIMVPAGWSDVPTTDIPEFTNGPKTRKTEGPVFYNAVLLPFGGAMVDVEDRGGDLLQLREFVSSSAGLHKSGEQFGQDA